MNSKAQVSQGCPFCGKSQDRAEGLTLLEMVIAIAIMAIVFAVLLPQFRAVLNSWKSQAGAAETLQNGRVLMDHLSRNLSKAVRITAVSNFGESVGFIEFEDNDSNSLRYDVDDNNYVQFGIVGSLYELAGPVSRLEFTCYDACDLDTPLDVSIADLNDIRFVKVETTLTNAAAMGQDIAFTACAFLRINAITCQGLVGWWKLDETSGLAAADSSGNGNDGTLENMAGDEWTTGPVDGALAFDGTNDYIDVSSLSATTDKTFSCWIYINSLTANYHTLIEFGNDAPWFGLAQWSGNWYLLEYTEDCWGKTSLSTGQWYHIAYTSDSGTNSSKVYLNGVEDTWSATNANTQTGSGMGIAYHSGDTCFKGIIDDVRLYNRALEPEEIAQLVGVQYQEFTEAKAGSETTSITLSTAGGSSSETVGILGSWTSGLTHTAEAGSNRLLILTAHVEDNDADMSLNSVTYGGQSMTKVIERQTNEGGIRAYVVAYILDEAGIAAASGSSFSPSWSSTPDSVGYSSVFLENVNQTSSVGASASNGSNTASTISTSALSTNDGDMVVVAGTAGYTGTYSVNNGFTEAIELSMTSSDGIAGYKAADGSDETPSITHSNPYRQVIIGFVVQSSQDSPVTGIEGDLLVAAVATDGDTSSSLAPPGGEGWTEIDVGDYGNEVTLGAWWKLADASESGSHEFTWSGDEQAYAWMMRFTGHDPADPIDVSVTDGESSSSPISPAVTTTVSGALILRLGGFDDDDITVDDPGLSGHTAITMDQTTGGSQVTYEEFTEAKASSNVMSITIPTPTTTSDTDTVRDEFASISYTGNNGTQNWSNSWQELGESDGAGSGRVRVISRSGFSSYTLRIGGDEVSISGRGASREADLSGASSATLRFDYGRSGESGGSVTLAVSDNGGSSWTDLQTYTVGGSQGATTETFDITSYIASNTQIRFLGSGSTEEPGYIYFDDVQIAYYIGASSPIEGDLLIAAVATDGSETISPPGGEGWTLIDHGAYSSYVTLGVWWKLAETSEPTSHEFTWGSTEQAYGWMMRFTGHDSSDPIDDSAATGGYNSSPTSPAVTTTVVNTMIVRIGGFDDDDITVDSPGLSGHTAITMDESNPSSSYSCSGGAGYVQQAGIGDSGTSAFSLTGSEEYRTVTIAIAPALPEGMVSGGAGYVRQSAAGDSGESDFSLTASEQSQMLTIAIAPEPGSGGDCGGTVSP